MAEKTSEDVHRKTMYALINKINWRARFRLTEEERWQIKRAQSQHPTGKHKPNNEGITLTN